MLTVVEAVLITPAMRRVVLRSPELTDFVSLSPDDHIKLFMTGPDGVVVMRDYTPRHFDPDAGELVIDFAVHDVAGPATLWASTAKPGDQLEIGGPRGSAIIPEVFDWYLLVGDETAFPAIGRRLEEFERSVAVTTLLALDGPMDQQDLQTKAQWRAEWIFRAVDGRDDVANVVSRIERLPPQSGAGFIWIAGEAQFAKALRAHFIDVLGHPPARMKAAGYWRRGSPGAHESLD